MLRLLMLCLAHKIPDRLGRSSAGEYGLPRNLDILQRHRLKAVFFVEPLFSLRFGQGYLQTVVDLIQGAGQDVQLHMHPEWVDEITPPLLENVASKRQHLTDYTTQEQIVLLGRAKQTLEAAAGKPITAFRSGGYAANRQTYTALSAVGIRFDSSLNATFNRTAGTLGANANLRLSQRIDGVSVHPVTVFRDGRARWRHLQVGACGFQEMREVLDQAHGAGVRDLVFVSHNFELLKPGGCRPDRIVERRFDKLCAYLAKHDDRFQVVGFDETLSLQTSSTHDLVPQLRTGLLATGMRVGAQAFRRIV